MEEAKRKAEEEARKGSGNSGGKSGGDPLIPKSARVAAVAPELKLEFIPNDAKLEEARII